MGCIVERQSFPKKPLQTLHSTTKTKYRYRHNIVSQAKNTTVLQAYKKCYHCLWILYDHLVLTRALLGGGAFERPPPPSGFSRIAKKRRRAAPPGFHPPYPPSFPQLLWKFRLKAMWGQVTRSGQVTQLQNNFPIAPRLQCFRESYELSEYDEVISAYKTYILDFWYRWPKVRSFLRPPHSKSMGKKSTLLYLLWRKHFWVESYRIGQLWTIRVKNCITYPSKGHLRSPEVTNRNLPITFDQKKIGDVGLVSVRSSWPGESSDMQYDPYRSSRDLGLTWPEVKLWPWPFKVILYMVRRALTRQTQWYQIRCSIFKIKDFIVEKPFGKFWNFDPWRPQFWPERKNDRNDFEMIFRELSNAAFRFSLRRPGAEIMGEAFKRPPPPAGGGKSRGPAGRGLTRHRLGAGRIRPPSVFPE